MKCLFSSCTLPCNKEAKYIIKDEMLDYGLCEEHFKILREEKAFNSEKVTNVEDYKKLWNKLKKRGNELGLFLTKVPMNLEGNLYELMEEYEKKYLKQSEVIR